MAYDAAGLLSRFRSDMDDQEAPYLWSDDEVNEYFDEAQEVLAEEADLLRDSITLAFTADEPRVVLPPYVTRVRQVNIDGGKRLRLYNYEEWEANREEKDYGVWVQTDDWETDTAETPDNVITDEVVNKLRLHPIPTTDGTLRLRVFRGPRSSMADGADPELVNRQQQSALLNYARHLAYLKHDSETYNPQLAEEQLAIYESKRSDLVSRAQRRSRRASTVAYGGIP